LAEGLSSQIRVDEEEIGRVGLLDGVSRHLAKLLANHGSEGFEVEVASMKVDPCGIERVSDDPVETRRWREAVTRRVGARKGEGRAWR
jgi:hypothetical protein